MGRDEECVGVAGVVYVGRASFRMGGGGGASLSSVIVEGVEGVETSSSVSLPVSRLASVPTERIFVSSAGARQLGSSDPARRRKPFPLIFAAAFFVGVACTLAGQIVLHSRETAGAGRAAIPSALARQEGPGSVPSALPAPSSTVSVPSARPETGAISALDPDAVAAAVVDPATDDDVMPNRKASRRHRRHVAAHLDGRQEGGVGGGMVAKWADPFAEVTKVAPKLPAADAPGWVDPFAPH